MNNKQSIAIFDFDKTITSKHTFIRFLKFISGNSKFYYTLFLFIPEILKCRLGLIDIMMLREYAIMRFFKGINKQLYLKYCNDFICQYVNKWVSCEAVNKIRWHKANNHKLVLLSNSPEDYLRIWAKPFDFDFVMGSIFEFKEGIATGRIVGNHCFGREKVFRLESVFGDLNQYYTYGYGDSKSDMFFLNRTNEAFYKKFDLKKEINIIRVC